jgi:regulator of protease activity HflC (stomatin/prohibitin superfamily)
MIEDVIPLERAERRAKAVRDLEARLDEARLYRDDAIRQALAAGYTVRAVADATGIHYSYISRVGKKEDPR